MKSIQHAVGAFFLACLSGTAFAKTVQVDFTVNVTSKINSSVAGGKVTTVADTAFQPMSFAASFRFDVDKPFAQDRATSPRGGAEASAAYNQSVSSASFTATPFTASLQLPAPTGATLNEDAYAYHGQDQFTMPITDRDQVTPVMEQITLQAQTDWQVHGLDGPGTVSLHMASRTIQFMTKGKPKSFNQVIALSGEDTLDFLQTQVGVLHSEAFVESGGHAIWASNWRDVIGGSSTEYRGDVLIRSVSVVPEPGVLLLSMVGAGVVALRAGRKQR